MPLPWLQATSCPDPTLCPRNTGSRTSPHAQGIGGFPGRGSYQASPSWRVDRPGAWDTRPTFSPGLVGPLPSSTLGGQGWGTAVQGQVGWRRQLGGMQGAMPPWPPAPRQT